MNKETHDEDGEVVEQDTVKYGTHAFMILLSAFVILFFLWATFSDLDIVSATQGEVLPSTKLKRIQHLEGGIVDEVKVQEGQKVTKGQPLVVLESTASFSDVQQLELQIDSMRIDIARLETEQRDLDKIDFPHELLMKNESAVSEAKKVFKLRRDRKANEVRSQKEQIEQRDAELSEVNARLKNERAELELLDEQVGISEDLLKEDLTNRYNHIDLLRSANSLKSRIEEDEASITRLQSALEEARSNLQAVDHKFKDEVGQQLEESRRELSELNKKMEKYADSLERTVLIAPVDGVVKQLYINSQGEVVKAGETILDILPSGDRLIVDAKLPIKDIGYVAVGQSAMIRLASAESMRFDHIDGKVVFISPDTIQEDQEEPFYRIRIETDKDYFSRGETRYKLYPGMQVMANVHTGKRSVMSYLFDPFTSSFSDAMKER